MKNPDRLYELLPVVHRMRDAEQGYPLQALLRVIAEQVNVVEDDIAQLYENWFIETCEEWAVPYIGDLVGYELLNDAGEPGDVTTPREQQRERILIPRRDVANTIHARRRKGTLALLEELAMDVADWPARAVEFYKLLGWTQNVHSPYLNRPMYHAARIGETMTAVAARYQITVDYLLWLTLISGRILPYRLEPGCSSVGGVEEVAPLTHGTVIPLPIWMDHSTASGTRWTFGGSTRTARLGATISPVLACSFGD
jgi:hypothetical protein